jgi:hypothetical protein
VSKPFIVELAVKMLEDVEAKGKSRLLKEIST